MAIGVTPELTTGRLTGQVVTAMPDGSDGGPVGGAHNSLHSSINDPVITETMSDNEGQYVLKNIATGRYYLG